MCLCTQMAEVHTAMARCMSMWSLPVVVVPCSPLSQVVALQSWKQLHNKNLDWDFWHFSLRMAGSGIQFAFLLTKGCQIFLIRPDSKFVNPLTFVLSTSRQCRPFWRRLELAESLETLGISDGNSLTAVVQIPQLTANERSFALWCCGGNVVTWGDAGFGGDCSKVKELKDIQHLCASHSAFAAISQSGQRSCWGDLPGTYDLEFSNVWAIMLMNNSRMCCFFPSVVHLKHALWVEWSTHVAERFRMTYSNYGE